MFYTKSSQGTEEVLPSVDSHTRDPTVSSSSSPCLTSNVTLRCGNQNKNCTLLRELQINLFDHQTKIIRNSNVDCWTLRNFKRNDFHTYNSTVTLY